MEAFRVAILDASFAWERTPWRHRAAVRGAGVDCGQFLRVVFRDAGLVPDFDTGAYPPDWHLNRSEERFIGIVRQFLDPIADAPPLPGDVAVWRFGRCFAHGAIVIAWPSIIHACRRARSVVRDDGTAGQFVGRDVLFFSIAGRVSA